MYILLLMLFMAEPRPLTIVVDDNRNSRMIVRDFTYDWASINNEQAKRFSEIQQKLKPRIIFIDVTSLDSKVLKYRNSKYPYLFYGERLTHIDYLPDESFMMASFPLLSVESYLNKIEFDYSTYKAACDKAEERTGNKYEMWLINNKPDIFSTFMQKNYSVGDYDVNLWELKNNFDKLNGVPVFVPDYPERPRIWYPWEKEYELNISNKKYERPNDENRP